MKSAGRGLDSGTLNFTRVAAQLKSKSDESEFTILSMKTRLIFRSRSLFVAAKFIKVLNRDLKSINQVSSWLFLTRQNEGRQGWESN
jgi:hypothetical protein